MAGSAILIWFGLYLLGPKEPEILRWGAVVWGVLAIPWTLVVWWRGFIEVTPTALRWCRPRVWDPFAAPREVPRAAVRRVYVVHWYGRAPTSALAVDLLDGTREKLSSMDANMFRSEVEELGKNLADALGVPFDDKDD